MSRTSSLTKKAEAEIERLTSEGEGARRIAKELERIGIRAIDGSPISRHQVGRYQRKIKEERAPLTEPSAPVSNGVGERTSAPVEIVQTSPGPAVRPTNLPGIRTDSGAPTTTRIERVAAIRWIRSLLAVEIPLIVERIEGGGARLRRCSAEDPCLLSDSRRLDHFTRSVARFDKVLKSAEEEGIGSQKGKLLDIEINLSDDDGDPADEEGRSTSDLLPPEYIDYLDEYLAMRGGSYEDFLEFLARRLE